MLIVKAPFSKKVGGAMYVHQKKTMTNYSEVMMVLFTKPPFNFLTILNL